MVIKDHLEGHKVNVKTKNVEMRFLTNISRNKCNTSFKI